MPKPNVKYVSLRFSGKAPVEKKRVRQANGKIVSMHTVDADSPRFDWELSTVFAKNVAKARTENADLLFNPKTSKPYRMTSPRMKAPDALAPNPVKPPKKQKKAKKSGGR